MEIDWWQMLLALVVSFIGVGLKGFQHKNVLGDHEKLVFFTSYAMAIADVLSIGLIAKNGWIMAIPVGTGAAFGMVIAMRIHKRFVKKTEEVK